MEANERFATARNLRIPIHIGGSGRENSCDLLFFRCVADTREQCDQPASQEGSAFGGSIGKRRKGIGRNLEACREAG